MVVKNKAWDKKLLMVSYGLPWEKGFPSVFAYIRGM